MPSFLIRGLARYFAASVMESRARRQSSVSPSSGTSSDDNKKLSDVDLASWQIHMRWLIPLAQATGYQIVIDNPKSHEQIIIDQDTKVLPELTIEWMQKYNKQELHEWMEKEKERQQQEEEERRKNLEAHRIEEARGRARFGNSFMLNDQNIKEMTNNSQIDNAKRIGDYIIPILCLYVFILVLVAILVYNSSAFAFERYEKESAIFSQANNVVPSLSQENPDKDEYIDSVTINSSNFFNNSSSTWLYSLHNDDKS